HGEEFWDHGGFEHGHTLYQELLHVPLVITGIPRDDLPSPDTPVGLVDLAPTILELAGLPIPESMRGSSLLDREGGERTYVSGNLLYGDTNARSLRKGPWKTAIVDGSTRLFDLDQDPSELHDLAEQEPDRARSMTPTTATTNRGVPVQLSETEQDALRALGYLE
ncbi:MAG: hypothetical protein QGG40_18835, partial [Myxococcota bacterium]|nr:hypothetical protein [Myxococcota bacterium]